MDTSTISLTDQSFELGLVVLLIAQILSSFMGVYVQDVYAEHGNHWRENLFYSHFLSLPMFIPLQSVLSSQYTRLQASQPMVLPSSLASSMPQGLQKLIGS